MSAVKSSASFANLVHALAWSSWPWLFLDPAGLVPEGEEDLVAGR